MWLPNANGHSISEFNSSGVFQTTASAPGNALLFPEYMGFDPTGNLWVASSNNTTNSLMKFSSSGSYTATYTGNGLTSLLFGLAIDHSGNVWLSNGSSVSEFSNSGGVVGSSPFTTGLSNPVSLALDSSSRLWVLNNDTSVTLLNSSGGVVTGTPYNTGSSTNGATEAIDGAGSDWIITNSFGFPSSTYGLIALSSTGTQFFSNSGTALSFNGYGAEGLAIDGSGDVWVTGGPQVVEFIGAASPVVTPVAANLVSPYSAPASRP